MWVFRLSPALPCGVREVAVQGAWDLVSLSPALCISS